MPQSKPSQAPRKGLAALIYRKTKVAIAVPLLLVYFLSNQKELIRADCERWIELLGETPSSATGNLLFLLGSYKEFRTLYYYRVWHGNLIAAATSLVLQAFYKGEPTLHLRSPEIGPGFFTQHGYASSVGAYRVGKHCSINQLVVIGWTDRTRGPILGDNVSVKAGAKVLGPITIGDNVTVGANAVVTKDVPANCVVVGVPARIIRRNGVRVDEPLVSRTNPDESFSLSLCATNEQDHTESTALDRELAHSSRDHGHGTSGTERSRNPI
jgi:serine O-acetyltransferase